jgi:diacylglycerol O-acyltransferase
VEQLAAMDASFLYFETPTMPQHVLGVMLFDVEGSHGRFTVERFREVLEERIHLLPAFERTLVQVPLHLDHPYWVRDHDVDIDQHLHRTTCPAPGDLEALGRLVGEIGSTPLDRDRPLWEIHVVEGLQGGQVALVAKIHHASMYGAAGADMMAHLLDLEPDSGPVAAAVREAEEPAPSAVSLLLKAGVHSVQRPSLAVQALAGGVRRVGKVGGMVAGAVRTRVLPSTPPRSVLNGRLTAARQAAFTKVSMEDLKAVKNAYGTKLNDVVLAAVTEALREYMLKRDALPSRPLSAAVPMNLGAGATEGTNKLTTLFVSLPVLTEDPVDRLREVAAASAGSKDTSDALGPEALNQVTEFVPPLLVKGGSKLYDGLGLSRLHPPLLSLVVSNVQGPPIPLYCAGAQVRAVYPFGPLLPGAGLNITVLSNMGTLDVGLLCCPDLVDDVWEIADAIPAAVATLLARAPR